MPYLNKLIVGSRQSALARTQVQEVLQEIRLFHPALQFEVRYVATIGDRDLTTSLRDLGKTDFFTKELDELVLNGTCRVAIHSAKDLPDPLPPGIALICLTKGLNPADALVLKPGITLKDLPTGAKIATSSIRREEKVREMRSDLSFCDLRGTIEQRLAILEKDEVDGVVIAEAALIRLGLTHLNRIFLPLPTVEGQGRLAITARQDDLEMAELFACLNNL